MIKVLLISAFIMLGIAIAVLAWEFVYGQPLEERKIENQFEDHFENAMSNITGIPFDLHANYSKRIFRFNHKKIHYQLL